MPPRVASKPTATTQKGRGTDSTISTSSTSSHNDGWDSGVEGAAKKRIQKDPWNSSMNSERRSGAPNSSTALSNGDFKSTRRRQSSIPNGPRPLNGTGRRNVTNPHSSVNSNANESSSVPLKRNDSINNISRFSFASITPAKTPPPNESESSNDSFLPPVNFDDFHESISSASPHLSAFPLPGQGMNPPNISNETTQTLPQTNIPAPTTSTNRKASGASLLGRTGSLNRQQSNASNTSRASSKTDSQSSGGTTIRARRQSHFPPNSFNNPPNTAKPRKSIGPGTFVPPEPGSNPAQRRPSITKRSTVGKNEAMGLAIRTSHKPVANEQEATSANTRTIRAKSLQPAPKGVAEGLLSPSKTPDHNRSPSTTSSGRAAGKNSVAHSGSPSSSAKRMSTMPSHASGLGARTISPTDARRMKRMSMMPPSLPSTNNLPQSPLTPQQDPMPKPPQYPFPQSPAQVPKSATPSSSRTTPDPHRKSYSSGQSLSSSTSFNSIRNSVGPVLPRIPQSASSSRLSTPKARAEGNQFAFDEEVPPVPAIPKAYESPLSDIDQPFFSARSSSLIPLEAAAAALESPTTDSLSGGQSLKTPTESISSSRKSSLVPEQEPKQKGGTNVAKKNLQPLRLPPLNLLPLSTPTAAKIQSFDGNRATDQGTETPPPRLPNTKTPSTPMTASKASFSLANHDIDTTMSSRLRSSSSHFALRTEPMYRAPSSSSSMANLPISFEPSSGGVRNMSPFVSTSLPKNSGEFPPYMQPKLSGEFARPTGARVNGPRAPSTSAKSAQEDSAAISDSQSSAFSAAAIRRKLSLARRKSESKPRETTENNTDSTKYDNMPPPKLPASATWSNLAATSTSPVTKPNHLKSRRKTSNTSVTTSMSSVDLLGDTLLKPETRPSLESSKPDVRPNRSSSLFTSAQAPSVKPSTYLPRSLELGLDRDDLVAEDEMKRLASKRKDFESAARELDNLRERAKPRERMSPSQASQMTSLNIFERGEIVDYKDVYFTGTRTAKKHIGDLSSASTNFGYDDERGDYNIVEGDHLAYRYEVVDVLGKGSFGQVVRCVDHKTGILVAVKIIRNKKRFHQQALVEVNILQKLREWDPDNRHSCVNFDQNFYFRGHLCISTDLLGMNLYEFTKAHDFRGFSLKLIRRFTKQILGSLILLHAHKVIHCDLKPENILLAHPVHSEIKVIDFGSSCFENEKVYTYIQSRFYRSPEVILGMSYGMPIDMWSLGCILAELYTGYPIFPGENEQEQLACIMEVFGPPEKHLIEKSTRKKLFFDSMGKPRMITSSKGRRRRPSSKDLRQALKCDDEAFVDFIARCLRWDPARRMSPHDAATHEFITGHKTNVRARGPTLAAASTASPAKRMSSNATGTGARPLPQPPATSFKNGSTIRGVDNSNATPAKTTTSRRQSTLNNLQTPSTTSKRVSHATALPTSSSLPRVAGGQRNVSNKPDMATAAAVTSLKSR